MDTRTERCTLKNINMILYGSTFSFVIPLLIMILMFALMARKLRMQLSKLKAASSSGHSTPKKKSFDVLSAAERSSSSFFHHSNHKKMSFPYSDSNSRRITLQKSHNQYPSIESRKALHHQNSKGSKGGMNSSKYSSFEIENNETQKSPNTGQYQLRRHAARSIMHKPSFSSSIGSVGSTHFNSRNLRIIKYSPNNITIDSLSLSPNRCTANLMIKNNNSSIFSSSPIARHRYFFNYTTNLTYYGGGVGSGMILSSTNQTTHHEMHNEVKALQVLGIVFIAFIIAWLPFCFLNMLSAFFVIYKIHVPNIEIYLIYLTYLGYLQSTFNPIIYTIFNKKFRKNFIELLTCETRNKKYNYKRNVSMYR